jgi:hypothetical protein
MNTRHSRGISRAAAEQLLDGRTLLDHADPGTDQLARVLAAASAPARDGELAGEQMAMAAFEASRLAPVATSVTPQKEHTSMLGKFLTAKVLLSTVAAFATGGVALAASTGALTSSHPTAVTATTSTATPTVSATAAPSIAPSATPKASQSTTPTQASTAPAAVPSSSAAATPSASSTAASLPTTAEGLCEALAGDVDSVTGSSLSPAGLLQALSKASVLSTLNGATSEFSSLISTAEAAANVSDYCALLLDLPQLPDPSQLASLPSALLGQLLTALPTSTLTSVLTSLPTSVLSQVLSALPTSALSTVLTTLPTSVLSQLLSALPTSALSTLLNTLPSTVLSQVLAELPSSLLSQLPSSLLGQL